MKIKNTILYPLLLTSSLLFAEALHVESVGVNVGVASIEAKQSNTSGTITLAHQPDESFASAELYALIDGVFEDKSKKITTNYIYSSNSDIQEHNLLLGVNKYYEYKKYNLYAGALAGISRLKWKYNPINNAKDKDFYSTSFTAGVQGGVEYPLSNTLLIGINAKYLYSGHKANLNPSTGVSGDIKHHNLFALNLGVRVSF